MGGPCPPPPLLPIGTNANRGVCRALGARRCSAEVYADIKSSKLQLPRDSFVVAAMRYVVAVPRIHWGLIRKDGGGFVNAPFPRMPITS